MNRSRSSRISLMVLLMMISITTTACSLGFLGGKEPLDEETLNNLTLSFDQNVQMQPGETHSFSLGVVECCYFFEPVEASATWSVEPAEGASIDPSTGVLTVDPDTPDGSVFTVSADVENGRRVVSVEVHVFTAEENPFVGNWREETQFACGTEGEVLPEELIQELAFRADGTFSVTWMPFEIYYDYWGTYEYDLVEGTLDLVISGGNYVPDDMDGSGFFSFDEQGRLTLHDMWLGRWQEATGPANCDHRFTG
jgi:hypothetical protein